MKVQDIVLKCAQSFIIDLDTISVDLPVWNGRLWTIISWSFTYKDRWKIARFTHSFQYYWISVCWLYLIYNKRGKETASWDKRELGLC